ncbi:MAG: SAM-dependent chlorinase/fluorinase [Candidatus Rokubacteria bacterium]|nr:SAM-dependent chlorinase/fluorinase [Candidatus Rokubacteria bacterium]
MLPLLTLTTDFGTRDSYVAEMKAAVLSLAPGAHLVDVTHDVGAHDVVEAALTLEAAAARFPAGTVHVAVVDPGVGTARRGIVVTARGQRFVGPDNGLFTPFLAGEDWRAFELSERRWQAATVSRTFHGRDVFAPAAARLALGLAPDRFGPAVDDPVRLLWPEVLEGPRRVAGVVLHADRFGNLITSVGAATLARLGTPLEIAIAGRRLPLVGTYGDLARGRLGGLVGSRERLEIVVREGSAAAALRARRGTRVLVSRTISRARRSRSSTLRSLPRY